MAAVLLAAGFLLRCPLRRDTLWASRATTRLVLGMRAYTEFEPVPTLMRVQRVSRGEKMGLHQDIANAIGNPDRVYCRTCGSSQPVDSAECLTSGWPKCCGYTMTIDKPDSTDRGPAA